MKTAKHIGHMPPPLVLTALAVVICALVRLVQITQLHKQVRLGQAGRHELAELSGITDPLELQDVFGPPDMNRIWHHVSMDQIRDKRRFSGFLMSDIRLHALAIAGSIGSLILPHPGMIVMFYVSVLIEVTSWLAAARLR